jgi:hypothetical protein
MMQVATYKFALRKRKLANESQMMTDYSTEGDRALGQDEEKVITSAVEKSNALDGMAMRPSSRHA